MDSIIAENLRTEQSTNSRINLFFSQIGISKLLRKSNFYKKSGIPCVAVLRTIFTLVFTDRNLYRNLATNPEKVGVSKNTVYRFLNSASYNWSKLLLLIAECIIAGIHVTTSSHREKVLVVDDSLYSRNRSKKVELLARTYDHSIHKFVKGFKMLTVGWSDGNSFIPIAFSLLSSKLEKNRLCPSLEKDKRTAAFKRRQMAISKSTDVLMSLINSVKHLPAKYVLFDSWFGLPKTICQIKNIGFHVICMVKNSSKIHYFYNDQWIPVSKLNKIATENYTQRDNITGTLMIFIRESKKSEELIPAKLVFVKPRNSKEFITILSTDTNLSEEEIVRIYGKRWDIEVFFKVCKSHLALAKEFQGRSYDMLISHTVIVFLRYIMLALEARNSTDLRTVGGMFYDICDEVDDIHFQTSLSLILSTLKEILGECSVLSEQMTASILDTFFKALPPVWQRKLQLCA